MTLAVEDGSGLTAAESYLSVADADSYIMNYHGTGTLWSSAADADKEKALRQGAQLLDAMYVFIGRRSRAGQGLAWPRVHAFTAEGDLVEGVPRGVARANAELALRIVSGVEILPDREEGPRPRRQKIRAGEVSESREWADGTGAEPVFPLIDRLLMRLVVTGTCLMRR